MDPTQEVCYPYVVMLHNLPYEPDSATGKLKCSYSNQDLAGVMAEFAGQLKNTIKVVYLKDGVVLHQGAAFAYAQFRDFHHAIMVDQAFKNVGRGKSDYKESLSGTNCLLNNGIVYGWMADERDFEFLAKRGHKKLKEKCVKHTVKYLMENKKKEYEELQRQIETKKQEMAGLDDELNQEQGKLNLLLDKLSEAKLQHREALDERDKEAEKRRDDFNHRMMQFDEELNEWGRKERMAREDHRRASFDRREREKTEGKKRAAQQRYYEMKKERDKNEKRCQQEEKELEELTKSIEEGREKIETERKEVQELVDGIQELLGSEEVSRMIGFHSIMDEGLNLSERKCSVCFTKFTEVLSFEQQLADGISLEEFERMNQDSADETRCWRNIMIPCGHAKVCGNCANDWQNEAVTKQKDLGFLCPTCSQPVKSYHVFRVSRN